MSPQSHHFVPFMSYAHLKNTFKKNREIESSPVFILVRESWRVKKRNNTYNYTHLHTVIIPLDPPVSVKHTVEASKRCRYLQGSLACGWKAA